MAADLKPNLETLLSEIELLQSMYPGDEELKIYEGELLDIRDFCSGRSNEAPNGLNLTLTIQLEEQVQESCFKSATIRADPIVELACHFPREYPNVKPNIFARSQFLSREIQKELNESLNSYISTLDCGELCALPVIQWIKDNGALYISRCQTELKASLGHKNNLEESDNDVKTSKNSSFLRMWLYMHHIYSKTKRKDILQWASDYGLTGFCLPGKPGVVCLEGEEHNVEEYFSRLRRLNWKKITCRHREKGESKRVDEQRKFRGFDELFFEVHGTRENHMDMGQFLQYLEQHKLGYMFQILFGIEGKSTSDAM